VAPGEEIHVRLHVRGHDGHVHARGLGLGIGGVTIDRTGTRERRTRSISTTGAIALEGGTIAPMGATGAITLEGGMIAPVGAGGAVGVGMGSSSSRSSGVTATTQRRT
jgi:hypothetical protein